MSSPTKEQWSIWKQSIRKWMEEHRSEYSYAKIEPLIDDAISAIGNPYNLDPDELWDMAYGIIDTEY